MKRLAAALLLLLTAASGPLVGERPAPPNKVVLNGHTFTLPPGFTIELAAKVPLVDRPISAAFDEQGRLYVTLSSGSNARGPVQAKEQTNRIVRLEDSDGDGVFDKATPFADKIALPEGALWYAGSLYVAAPPHILKLTDTDGDGKADRREVWFDGKTVGGCANDLHGPYLGPDGWIYWCKGAWELQTYTVRGQRFDTRASHVFRATPDGKTIEPVMAGGMDNPVGLAFTPGGEIIVSGTFFQFPAGGKRDGLIHVVHGGIYGKDHAPIHDPVHKWTGPQVLPIMTHLGAAAPCGMIRFESAAFGKEYKDNLFCCLFNMQKVTRHVLVRDGATFKTHDFDFLVSDQKDFHPTDVIEDADGSLLVVDTGGWYKICCPTSQLVKPDVFGAIYRVRGTGAPRVAVRGGAVKGSLNDPDETGRQAALHAVSLHADRSAIPTVLKLLRGASLQNRRAAAEALGRIGDRSAVPALLAAAGGPGDRMLEHSLTYALIEIADPEGTAVGLKSDNIRTRRAALVALDQMAGGKLSAETVAAELGSSDGQMKETAWWIAGRHPEWGNALAGFLRQRLAADNLTPAERNELTTLLARFAHGPAVQELLLGLLRDSAAPAATRTVALKALAQAGPKEAPAEWLAAVTGALRDADAAVIREAVSTARALRLPKQGGKELAVALRQVGGDPKRSAELRMAALAAVPGGLDRVEPPLFDFLRTHLQVEQPVAVRSAAADVLGRAKLDAGQLIALAGSLKGVGPMEVERLLEAFGNSTEDRVGLALLAGLKASPVKSGVRVAAVKARLDKYGPVVRQEAEALYAALNVDTAKQRARLEAVLDQTKGGDVRRGQAVFNSAKAACSSCHAIGYLGGTIGPDLTRIAGVRTERDLVEAIVFPSASFVRGYEPVVVSTREGKLHNGVVRRDGADELVLATGPNQEVRIPREDVEEVQPSQVSVMPAGLDGVLTPAELADLIAFLKTCK